VCDLPQEKNREYTYNIDVQSDVHRTSHNDVQS
jgi:hypothetical protein